MNRDAFDALRTALAARRPRRCRVRGAAQASVALVLTPGRGGLRALLIRRAQDPADPWSGHIALPGGRRAPGERRLEAAIRETWEEAGVRLAREELLGELDDVAPLTPALPPVTVRPYVFAMGREPKTSPGPEAADCFWTPLRSLPASACRTTVRVRGIPREVSAYRLGPLVIWGITYRILDGFLAAQSRSRRYASEKKTFLVSE